MSPSIDAIAVRAAPGPVREEVRHASALAPARRPTHNVADGPCVCPVSGIDVVEKPSMSPGAHNAAPMGTITATSSCSMSASLLAAMARSWSIGSPAKASSLKGSFSWAGKATPVGWTDRLSGWLRFHGLPARGESAVSAFARAAALLPAFLICAATASAQATRATGNPSKRLLVVSPRPRADKLDAPIPMRW